MHNFNFQYLQQIVSTFIIATWIVITDTTASKLAFPIVKIKHNKKNEDSEPDRLIAISRYEKFIMGLPMIQRDPIHPQPRWGEFQRLNIIILATKGGKSEEAPLITTNAPIYSQSQNQPVSTIYSYSNPRIIQYKSNRFTTYFSLAPHHRHPHHIQKITSNAPSVTVFDYYAWEFIPCFWFADPAQRKHIRPSTNFFWLESVVGCVRTCSCHHVWRINHVSFHNEY